MKLFYFVMFFYPKYLLLYFFFLLFSFNYNYFYFYFSSLDNISEVMGILSMMIFIMSIFSVKNMSMYMYMLVCLSNYITILFFFSMNMFLFFLFFEMSLIPILFLILGWGYQVERLLASYMLLLYTSFLSFPFLMSLFLMKNNSFNFFLFFSNKDFFSFEMNLLFCLLFFVKTPIYFFHFWLPKAHVEASVTGSIILAGILLKMGSYGLYRMLFILKFKYFSVFMWFFLLGSLMSIILCLTQSDMKSMIAFSSVSHMSLMVFSMMQFSIISMKGTILLMFIHGIASSLFFFLMNFYYYYFMSRLFYYTQFMISLSKTFSMMMFWVIMMNISLPPMLSFFSEILLFFNLIFLSSKMMIFYVVLMSLLSCYYCIFMLTNMMYGKMKDSSWMMNSVLKSNIFILSFLIFSMNLLILLSLF